MKYCGGCGESKSIDQFSMNRRRKDGLQTQCKACYKAWRIENIERVKEKDRVWREANIDHVHRREAAYRVEHREERAATARKWNAANPERRRANRQRARDEARTQ